MDCYKDKLERAGTTTRDHNNQMPKRDSAPKSQPNALAQTGAKQQIAQHTHILKPRPMTHQTPITIHAHTHTHTSTTLPKSALAVALTDAGMDARTRARQACLPTSRPQRALSGVGKHAPGIDYKITPTRRTPRLPLAITTYHPAAQLKRP